MVHKKIQLDLSKSISKQFKAIKMSMDMLLHSQFGQMLKQGLSNPISILQQSTFIGLLSSSQLNEFSQIA